MKIVRLFSVSLAFAGACALSNAAPASDGAKSAPTVEKAAAGRLVPATEADAAWVAKAKANYPTTDCVVSEDKLGGEMGKPADFIYREEGKPDRLVSFCCKDCEKDFNKDPQKYLTKLDGAAAAKKSGDHSSHH